MCSPEDEEVVGEGNANKILRIHGSRERVLRVSKRNIDPQDVYSVWTNVWQPLLSPYMPPLEVCSDGLIMPYIEASVGEFKPKWLLQSPDAPENAVQCRTCALAQLRSRPQRWCPLDLAAGDFDAFLVEFPGCNLASVNSIIQKLLAAQLKYHISVTAGPTERLRHLMSVRDCTVMLSQTQPWIVDLDPKPPQSYSKWAAIERDLQPIYVTLNPVCRLSRTQL